MTGNTRTVGVRIQTAVEGRETVEQLTQRLDDMATLLDGELQADAKAAAAALRELTEQQEAIATFQRLQREAKEAGAALKVAEREATNYGQQMATAGPPTAAVAGHLQRLQTAADAARTRVQAADAAVSEATAALTRHGIAAQNTGAAQQRLAAQVDEVRQSVAKLAPAYASAASAAEAGGERAVRAHRAVGDGVQSISRQLQTLQNGFVALSGGSFLGGVIKDVAQTAEEYNGLAARIKLAVGEGQSFEAAMQGVQRVAIATRSDLQATGELFTRLYEAGKAQGQTQEQALALTETINRAIQISGASAQSSQAAITQLVQALQGGVLRGDEFNSIMEQAPRLAKALADGLGVATGELRQMAEQGQLTASEVTRALRLQADTVATEFAKMPASISGAMQNLSTAWTVYVGNADKAAGASRAAADAIQYLAQHLPQVADALYSAGKAAGAFAALRLAQHFTGIGAAAKVAAVEVAAASAAMAGTATAAGTAAGAAGRFAALLGGLRLGVLAVLISNFREIGTWIGESAAKLMGYRVETEKLSAAEVRLREELERKRQAQQLDLDMAGMRERAYYGLSQAGSGLVAKFEDMTKKGASAAEAIDAIGKDFDLSKRQGIRDASGVLLKLANDGKITAEQVQSAWAKALDGRDLGIFATEARKAFGSAGVEASHFKNVLTAIGDEAIKRAGTSVQELTTGFSAGLNTAINNTDALSRRLTELGVEAEVAGGLLAKSLDKEIESANTARALEAVRQRLIAMGKDGSLSGDQVAAGLDKVQRKADELKPGINSLAEAFRQLGLKSREELQATADKSAQAWERIRTDATTSIDQKIQAFRVYRDAAIAANGGVESSEVALQRRVLETEARVKGLGDQWERSMGRASEATRKVTSDLIQANREAGNLSGHIDRWNASVKSIYEAGQGRYDKEGFALNTDGQRVQAGDQLTPPDSSGDWTFVSDASYRAYQLAESPALVVQGVGYWARNTPNTLRAGQGSRVLGGGGSGLLGGGGNTSASAASTSVSTPVPPASGTGQTITLRLGSASTSFTVGSSAEAESLKSFLRQLESDAARAQGGY